MYQSTKTYFFILFLSWLFGGHLEMFKELVQQLPIGANTAGLGCRQKLRQTRAYGDEIDILGLPPLDHIT